MLTPRPQIGKGTSAFSTAFTYPQPFPPPPPPAPVPAAHRHATPHTLQHHPEAAVQRQARPSTSSAHPPERYRPATARKAPRIPSPPEERRPATSTHDKGWARSNAGREILGKWVHSRLQGVDGRGPVMVAKRVEIAYPIDGENTSLASFPGYFGKDHGARWMMHGVRGGKPCQECYRWAGRGNICRDHALIVPCFQSHDATPTSQPSNL